MKIRKSDGEETCGLCRAIGVVEVQLYDDDEWPAQLCTKHARQLARGIERVLGRAKQPSKARRALAIVAELARRKGRNK